MSFEYLRILKERWWRVHLLKDGYNGGGYEWCADNWGTKWNFCNAQLEDEYDGRLFYTFQTAWNPPTPVILSMSERFPALTFTLNYYEQSMGFMGTYKVKAGEILQDWYSEEYIRGRGG